MARSRASSSSPSLTSHRRPASTTTATSSPRATTDPCGPPRLAPLLLALLIAAFAVGGCGDGEDSTTTPAETGAVDGKTKSTGTADASPAIGDGAGGVELTEIGSFDAPLYLTQPDEGDDGLYVVEQAGRIQRLDRDGNAETFLDISDEITSGGEQGLLSMAFAPDFERSGLFYVDYTDPEGDTRIVEYEAEDGVADESTARELLKVDQPYENHNGGLVLFGPDDLLYIGLGDGGAGGDPERRGLDLTTPLGKILRIDPEPDGNRPYTVPRDNPFAGSDTALPEIYSYGLRNPWRFAFDAESGDLVIGDVGQDAEEEVDVVAEGDGSGASFGWSAFEGNQALNDDQKSPDAIEPALVATHEDGNCSITGGLTVRDRDLSSLYGRYVYGDLCLGELRSFTPEPGRQAADDVALGLDVESLSSFGEDADGNVYAMSISGPVYRLDPVR